VGLTRPSEHLPASTPEQSQYANGARSQQKAELGSQRLRGSVGPNSNDKRETPGMIAPPGCEHQCWKFNVRDGRGGQRSSGGRKWPDCGPNREMNEARGRGFLHGAGRSEAWAPLTSGTLYRRGRPRISLSAFLTLGTASSLSGAEIGGPKFESSPCTHPQALHSPHTGGPNRETNEPAVGLCGAIGAMIGPRLLRW
jgi:hypothetical protein